MDFREMTAPCGLDCFNCPVYIASYNDDLRAIVAKRLNLPLEKAYCLGCRPHDGLLAWKDWTEPCSVYKCIKEKGLEICSDCDDFPCDNLHPYADRATEVPHNTKVFNLCLIKKMGLESWAEEKAAQVKSTYFKGQWKL